MKYHEIGRFKVAKHQNNIRLQNVPNGKYLTFGITSHCEVKVITNI